MKADELFQQLADIRTNGENAIRELLGNLKTKSLNVYYYVDQHEVENSGFSIYDNNAYSNPARLYGVEIDESGTLIAHLDGDYAAESYVEDMTAPEVAIILDILEQCVAVIEQDNAPVIEWGDESWYLDD